MEKYLKDRQVYIDRYDKSTVEQCRLAEKTTTSDFVAKHIKEGRDESELIRMATAFNELHVWIVSGEMYSKKEETIDQWMKEDEERDKFFENTKAPKGIQCLTCNREMFVGYKQLEINIDKPDRILFMYECMLNHLPKRAFFDDGEEWKYKKPCCVKCNTEVTSIDNDTEEMWKSTSTCPKCGHVEISEIKRNIKEPIDPDFEKDKARFCSEKIGMEYTAWMRNANELTASIEKRKEKENNKELYDAVAKIKRLKIIELEQLLTPILEKESYIKLLFKDPEIAKDVIVPFTIHDAQQGREEKVSCFDLQRLIKSTLKDTNWRLMSDGVSYRLGMLEGRFRAYEKEDDLVKLIKNER